MILFDEKNYLTEDEMIQFLNNIPENRYNSSKLSRNGYRLLYHIMYEGALRVSEVIRLTKRSVHQKEPIISLENTKSNKKRGGKRQFATIKKETMECLWDYCRNIEDDQLLFPITRQAVWAMTRKIGRIANIQLYHQNKDTTNLNNHALRHSRAIHFLNKKKPLNVVQKKLRHANIKTTSAYLQVSMSEMIGIDEDV